MGVNFVPPPQLSEAFGAGMPPSHDVVEINGRQVFTLADEVFHEELNPYDSAGAYLIGETLSRTEAKYEDKIVIMKRSIIKIFTTDLPWLTEQQITQQFRADIYDRGSEQPDDSLWTRIAQDRLSTFIPLPFFMLRAARLAAKAEETALDLARG